MGGERREQQRVGNAGKAELQTTALLAHVHPERRQGLGPARLRVIHARNERRRVAEGGEVDGHREALCAIPGGDQQPRGCRQTAGAADCQQRQRQPARHGGGGDPSDACS
eukprot:scaffold27538_cov101-Isochrysis_galbana.AAC.2